MFHRAREDSNRTHATETMIGHDMICNSEWDKSPLTNDICEKCKSPFSYYGVMPGPILCMKCKCSSPTEVAGPPMFDLSKNQDAHTYQRGILAERGKRYGAFIDNAMRAQVIKSELAAGHAWENMSADQREALDQIATKISRIVTGDPDYVDNWDDIAGFATLVADRLRGISGEDVSHGPDGHSTAVRRDDQLHNIQQGNASTHFSGCSD